MCRTYLGLVIGILWAGGVRGDEPAGHSSESGTIDTLPAVKALAAHVRSSRVGPNRVAADRTTKSSDERARDTIHVLRQVAPAAAAMPHEFPLDHHHHEMSEGPFIPAAGPFFGGDFVPFGIGPFFVTSRPAIVALPGRPTTTLFYPEARNFGEFRLMATQRRMSAMVAGQQRSVLRNSAHAFGSSGAVAAPGR